MKLDVKHLLKIKRFLERNYTTYICLNCLEVRNGDEEDEEIKMRSCIEKKHTIINNYDYEQCDSEAIIKFIKFLLKKDKEGK